MIEQISEEVFIEVKDEKEKFCLIDLREDFYYDPDPSLDEFIFKTQNYYYRELPFGQKDFCMRTSSLEEFFELVSYFTGKGYCKRMKRSDIDSQIRYGGPDIKKKVWSLEKIRENPKEILEYVNRDRPWQGWLYIEIIVDYNKLDKFRQDLKNIPGYKIVWLKEDREPKEPSIRIIK